ncbi:MlaD family protein [Patulibacter sp. NPDC049589]|uniref:MlaD family protein n=1 Tax=Patulibacter sp. NPDC049589 TaxID=3154731 RepID=UPI0034199FEE
MSPSIRRKRGSRRSVRHLTPEQTVRRNVLWGAATLLVAAILVFLVFGGGIPGTGPKKLEVLTKDAGVLRVGAATKVRVAGVDVGTVSGLKPADGKPGYSVITVSLNDKAPVFRRDATVKIRPRLFLEGNFFLDISPGSPDSPVLGNTPIPPGAVTLHVAADEVFSAFDSQTRENFQQTLKAFGEGLQGGGAEALNTFLKATPAALDDIAKVMKSARGTKDGDLQALVREAGGVLANLQAHEAGLRGTITGGRKTFDAFAANSAALQRTIAGLDTTTRRLMPQLTRINAAIPEGRALVRDARPLARRLPSFLDVANPALRSLLSLAKSKDVQGLTAELRPALRTISRSAEPLGTVADDLRPVAKCLNQNLLPILNSVVPDGSLTTNLKVYEELGGTFTGLGASTQEFDANGPWVRYLIGLGNQAISTNDAGGTLSATAERPIAGSTPTPVSLPPLRPDVPCETQAVPTLDTKMKPFVGTQTRANVDKQQVTEIVDKGLRTIQGLDEGGKDLTAIDRRLQTLLGPDTPGDAAATTGAGR